MDAIVVIEQRGSGGIPGLRRQEYKPFDIVPNPTAAEARLLAPPAGENFDTWWAGELTDPPRQADGSLYPALVQRPADGSLWVRPEPRRLIPLANCEAALACLAIRRCQELNLVAAVPAWNSRVPVRSAAQAQAAALVAGGQALTAPCALELGKHGVEVVLNDGNRKPANGFYAKDLHGLIADCPDTRVLSALAEAPYTPLAHAAKAQLRRLAEPEEEQAPEFDAAQPHTLTLTENDNVGVGISQGDWIYPLAALTIEQLKPLIAAATDVFLVTATQTDTREGVHKLAEKRLKELAEDNGGKLPPPQEQAAAGDKSGANPATEVAATGKPGEGK